MIVRDFRFQRQLHKVYCRSWLVFAGSKSVMKQNKKKWCSIWTTKIWKKNEIHKKHKCAHVHRAALHCIALHNAHPNRSHIVGVLLDLFPNNLLAITKKEQLEIKRRKNIIPSIERVEKLLCLVFFMNHLARASERAGERTHARTHTFNICWIKMPKYKTHKPQTAICFRIKVN